MGNADIDRMENMAFDSQEIAESGSSGVMPAAWLHIMDNTDGVEGAVPIKELTFSQDNPFGIRGTDYDAEYQVISKPLYLKA